MSPRITETERRITPPRLHPRAEPNPVAAPAITPHGGAGGAGGAGAVGAVGASAAAAADPARTRPETNNSTRRGGRDRHAADPTAQQLRARTEPRLITHADGSKTFRAGAGDNDLVVRQSSNGDVTIRDRNSRRSWTIESQFFSFDRVKIDTGAGNDRVTFKSDAGIDFGNRVSINGGAGNDRIDARGSARGVELDGGAGNDRIRGGCADDTLTGGSGRDRLYGGSGADRIRGDGLDTRLDGGRDTDRDFFELVGNRRTPANLRLEDRIAGTADDAVPAALSEPGTQQYFVNEDGNIQQLSIRALEDNKYNITVEGQDAGSRGHPTSFEAEFDEELDPAELLPNVLDDYSETPHELRTEVERMKFNAAQKPGSQPNTVVLAEASNNMITFHGGASSNGVFHHEFGHLLGERFTGGIENGNVPDGYGDAAEKDGPLNPNASDVGGSEDFADGWRDYQTAINGGPAAYETFKQRFPNRAAWFEENTPRPDGPQS